MKALQKTTYQTVQKMLERNQSALMKAVPKHLSVDRLMRLAMSELRTNEQLLNCSAASIVSSVVKASHLGLEIGSTLGQAYLVPYGSEASLIVGYRGLIALALRSGDIKSLRARVVYKGDTLKLKYGLVESLQHKPSLEQTRGDITHVYAIAELANGTQQFEIMTKAEIDAIKARSRSGNTGPWVTDYAEMTRKTVVRRIFKYLPISIDIGNALEADDDRQEIDITPNQSLDALKLDSGAKYSTEASAWVDANGCAVDKPAAETISDEFEKANEQN